VTQAKDLTFSIIAGELKGRKISTPDLGVTRPPLTRLRKSIFDYLMPYIDNAAYLDLFCGTGSYLFEAVSRGARRALGVELESGLSEAIETQASKYGVADRLKVITGDAFATIPQLAKADIRYDIIMIAPPQYRRYIDRTLTLLTEHKLLADGGQIICQHDSSETDKIKWRGFSVQQQRKYGNTTFTILQPK
jgi:16S rRNA (guanine(966)-N(2))-methyltransferase RsmD